MQFVKTEDLKTGMRLARPIYNRNGVLLFERNSKLTSNAIDSVKHFGLLGIYILEPAEPLPPLSEEDVEFEKFQTVSVFIFKDAVDKVFAQQRQSQLFNLANNILKRYGQCRGKVNFYQNIRSREDFVYRHSFNVAILCALMANKLDFNHEDSLMLVEAALVHDLAKVNMQGDIILRVELDDPDKRYVFDEQSKHTPLVEFAYPDGARVRRLCMQFYRQHVENSMLKIPIAAKVLHVANKYDEMTAMSLTGESKSEVTAIRELMDNPELYDSKAVDALVDSINILFPGVSVELNTGEKALVLTENPLNILKPTVLSFRDNSVINLALGMNRDVKIIDIMKTLDNRYIMDTATLREAGYKI